MLPPPPPPDLPPTRATHVQPHGADPPLASAAPTIDPDAVTLGNGPNDQLPQLRPPLVPGDLGAFGRHRVLRLLGRGGMGAVYEAIDTALGRTVALKLMLPALAASPTGRERFLREARAAAAVRHENVVSVYHVGEDEGTPFLTMELLQGDHLAHLIGSGLPIADVVRIGRDVARGLAAAHAIGVVHRDIKPANIWIEAPTGRVRLLDFGLARIGGEESVAVRSGSAPEADLTQAGEIIGTPTYMSREQVDGEPVDFRTDLFSLGAVLYQMVTGRVPFEGTTIAEWAAAIRKGTYTPVNEAVPAAPAALVRLIHALLSPRPGDRPRSEVAAAELLSLATQLLMSTMADSVPFAVPVPSDPDPEPPFQFNKPQPNRRRRTHPTQFFLGCAAALVGGLLSVGIVHRIQKAGHHTPGPVTRTTDPPPPPPPPRGPVSIFNGRDLSGWKPPIAGRSDAWAVANGALVGKPQNFEPQSLLSEQEYSDFELSLEYRWLTRGGHTLLLLRANDDADRYGKGLAISLADDEGYPAVYGMDIEDRYRTGVVVGLTSKPPAANQPFKEWNNVRVIARGPVIEVELNGKKMPVAHLDEQPELQKAQPEYFQAKGPIGLLCWVGTIEYRNIQVRPLP